MGLFSKPKTSKLNLGWYIAHNDEKYLKQAIHEVTNRSNPNNESGIQNRRDAEGALLSSHLCEFYTKPNQKPDAKEITIVKLNKTIIPLPSDPKFLIISAEDSHNGIPYKVPLEKPHPHYYVWRTQMDGKVRKSHLQREGKVFHIDDKKVNHPGKGCGEDAGCRCDAEALPARTIIEEEITEEKAFEIYLRTGLTIKINGKNMIKPY